ncbi:unnamed protein product, partial [Musa textilis]
MLMPRKHRYPLITYHIQVYFQQCKRKHAYCKTLISTKNLLLFCLGRNQSSETNSIHRLVGDSVYCLEFCSILQLCCVCPVFHHCTQTFFFSL